MGNLVHTSLGEGGGVKIVGERPEAGSVSSVPKSLQLVHDAEPIMLSAAGGPPAGEPGDPKRVAPSGDNSGCSGSYPRLGQWHQGYWPRDSGARVSASLGASKRCPSKLPITAGVVSDRVRFNRGENGFFPLDRGDGLCRRGGFPRYYPKPNRMDF